MPNPSRRHRSAGQAPKWLLHPTRAPGLERYVRRIEGYVANETRADIRRMSPTAEIPMVFVLGAPFTILDPRTDAVRRRLRHSFVAGLHERPTAIGSTGSVDCLQVDLTPIGAWRILGIDMSEIAGAVVDLRTLLGAAADELERRLVDLDDWMERFLLVEDFLLRRIAASSSEHPLSAAAFGAITRSNGDIRVGSLAADFGCSRKHLTTLFKREIGLAPKAFARVVRFERALARYRTGEIVSLSELAAACGYADQSHFNRDCRAFTGQAPSSLLAQASR